MLDSNWIPKLATVIIAGVAPPAAAIAPKVNGEPYNVGETKVRADTDQVKIDRGWIAIDGLPNEALGWDKVDADIIYALRITNGSHHNFIGNELELIDFLPEGISLNTADFDGGGPIRTSFGFIAGESGVELLPEDVEFSDDGGKTFEYSPNGQLDHAIGAIRIRPKGVIARNSSFTVLFRAQLP